MSTPDKIAAAKEKYTRLIAEKTAQIKDLETKLRLLSEIEDEIEIDTPFATIDKPQQVGFGLIDNPNYSKIGLTEAAYNALTELIRNHVKETTRTRVAKAMLDSGFKPRGKNFLISVDTALRRLVEAQKIDSTLKDGRRIYLVKNNGG